MTGSEKRINVEKEIQKWAKEIQKWALEDITEEIALAYSKETGREIYMDVFREYRQKIKTCEDARFFIDIVRHHVDCDSYETVFYWMEIEEEDEWKEYARYALGLR